MDEQAIQAALGKATEEVSGKLDAMSKSIDAVKGDFAQQAKGFATIEEMAKVKALGGDVEALKSEIGRIKVGANRQELDPKKGFKNHVDFLMDVMSAEKKGSASDRLKLCVKAVGSDEQSTFNNQAGGYLVPQGLFGEILGTNPFEIQADTGIMARQIPMSTQIVNVNARVDKNHSSSVTGGLQVYRRKEADSVTASAKNFEQIELKAENLAGIAYATEEILQASPVSFAALISSGFAEEYRSKLNSERISGTGVGEYLGVLNSPALVTIAKEGSQSNDTINITNVRKMRARIYGYQNAVWMINQDAYPQIAALGETTSGSNAPVFQPSLNLGDPDMLLGRPVIYDENMATLGDLGDIMLINWNEYLEGTWGGTSFAESIHVRFVNHETAFRFGVYNCGAPWWRTALTPKNSADTLSPFVALAAR